MKRLKIGNVELENPLILAPMAGVTDQPFRLLCREEGCGLAYTEMVSAKAILYKNRNTRGNQERYEFYELKRCVLYNDRRCFQ